MKMNLLKKHHLHNVPDLLVMYLLSLDCTLIILPLCYSHPFVILSEGKNPPFQNEDDARRDSTFRIRRKRFYLDNFQRATRFCGTYTGYQAHGLLWLRFGQRPTSLENGLGDFLRSGVQFDLTDNGTATG